MKKFLKYFGYFLLLLLPIIMIINCIEIFILKEDYLFKYKPSIILSGSMEPTLSIDDLVFTKKVSEIKIGDIIVFYDTDGKKIMHRVVEIEDDKVTTKGDANNTLDKPIKKEQVVGVYTGKVKYAGKIFKFLKSPIVLAICFIFVAIIFLLPSGKKETEKNDSQEDKTKKTKMMFMGIIYIILLVACIVAGYYSKYQKGLAGSDKTVVAGWNNNIELLSSDILHFQNGKKDTNLIKFNLIYESEVSANYNIALDNISKELSVELSDEKTTLGIKQANNTFIIDFNNNLVTFDIDQLRSNSFLTLNDIEATYEVDGTKDVYMFEDKTSGKIVKVIGDGERFNLHFINFGKFEIDDSHTRTFTLKVSAIEAELPNLNNLELYATFEQID